MNYIDEFGFPTSRSAIAGEIWHQQLTVAQRLAIMERVGVSGSLAVYYRRCIAYLAAHMVQFHVEGRVLTGEYKGE